MGIVEKTLGGGGGDSLDRLKEASITPWGKGDHHEKFEPGFRKVGKSKFIRRGGGGMRKARSEGGEGTSQILTFKRKGGKEKHRRRSTNGEGEKRGTKKTGSKPLLRGGNLKATAEGVGVVGEEGKGSVTRRDWTPERGNSGVYVGRTRERPARPAWKGTRPLICGTFQPRQEEPQCPGGPKEILNGEQGSQCECPARPLWEGN